MDELQQLRCQIDDLDRELVQLFRRRMAVTEQVGRYKAQRGLPVLDRERERQVLAAKAALVGDDLRADITTLFETVMALSRRQQMALVDDNGWIEGHRQAWSNCRTPIPQARVVYQGVPGAYSETAALDFFGPDAHCQGLTQFEDVFHAIQSGTADYGVVPIENSSTGAIRQIYDLLMQYAFYIVGETTVKVEHCLMAPKGASLDTITHVYSHEQGLFQCEKFLNRHPNWVQVPQEDTAGSARYVAACGDVTKGAVCSRRAAGLYDLEILAEAINHNSTNTTRFVVVSSRPELREGRNKISATFTLAHESGTLHRIMTVFATGGLNMMKLESRPIPERSWEYQFFVDFSGDLSAYGMDSILREMSQCSATLRILGNYRANSETAVRPGGTA